MAEIKLQKRDIDFFVSYAHGDLAPVAPLVDLLKRFCRLVVWLALWARNCKNVRLNL
jgi:hypothetical protein